MVCRRYTTAEFSPELHVAGSHARLRAYCREYSRKEPMPAVLILPGGGYRQCSVIEAEPVAISFLERGWQAFVLEYSVAPKAYPWQLLEAAAAMAFIRERAGDFAIDPGSAAVCGFSAGGHLAGCLMNLWSETFVTDALGGSPERFRPDAGALCYPVISAHLNQGSFESLGVSPDANPELSLHMSVSDKTPPCFIWHTADDPVVPAEGSMLMAEALRRAGRPFELHIFRHGPHAMSVCTEYSAVSADHINTHTAHWVTLCTEFFREIFTAG